MADRKYKDTDERREICYEIEGLAEIVKKLRSEDGCPWDKKQTEETLKPYVIEEAYEVVSAITSKDKTEIMEELGDLLLQVVFLSDIYEEKKEFSLSEVIKTINQKLVRRHPHVFDKNFSLKEGECIEDAILKNWERIKAEEKKEKRKNGPNPPENPSVYIPESMPSLHRAYMVQEKAKRIGFDFEDSAGAMDKVCEEISELKKELAQKSNEDKIIEEYGDILFSVVNLGRLLDIHPCGALNKSSDKFIRRFGYMEKNAPLPISKLDAKSLDTLWEESKKAL
ncbi:MAG: nucleoside triphosphate pyrophosphohydrolase [bacterium]